MPSRRNPDGTVARLLPGSPLFALVALTALLLASCSRDAALSVSADSDGVSLASGAAVSAMVGPEGGELTAVDPERGRSYRLTIPAGVIREATEITATPIASIEGFPLDGGLLGGLELEPAGAVFLGPVRLEIQLDAERRADLRSALEDGQAVVGFEYAEDPAKLAFTLADVADDLSTVSLTLFGFSGHGAGTGSPQDLANRPCPPDPAKAAECQIIRILHPPGGQADPNDPAVRADIAAALRTWFYDAIVPAVQAATDLHSFEDGIRASTEWYELARLFGLLTAFWYGGGDALQVEGVLLKGAALLTYERLFTAANEACKQNGDLISLRGLLELDQTGTTLGLIDSRLGSITRPGNFCLTFRIVDIDAPSELKEGRTGTISFAIESANSAVSLSPLDLVGLQVAGTFAATRPTLLDLAADTAVTDGLTSRVSIDATAIRSVSGSSDEGTIELGVTVLGLAESHASASAVIDITSLAPTPAPPITCSEDPTTITSSDEEAFIGIRFDGGTACAVVANLSDDDEPNAMLALDADPGESGWDAHDGGNWRRESLGSNHPSGTYSIRVDHVPSGRSFTLAFTVEVTLVNGGPAVRMTVRDVAITPVVAN
jgi:hypothetical protein